MLERLVEATVGVRHHVLGGVLLAAMMWICAALPAQADVLFNFSFVSRFPFSEPSASGVLDTTPLSPGQFTIVGVTGTAGVSGFPSTSITGLLAVGSPPTTTDNVLLFPPIPGTVLPPVAPQYLDSQGFGFATSGLGNLSIAFAASAPGSYEIFPSITSGFFTVSPVPEPSSLLLVATGIAGLATRLRRKF